ncbi:hypothetical protein [Campylobacter mucosalis]|uniref:Uncharacterized protein n=1 Tax=Campylobacter mucosalis CCUG 21559 TaxID=1032067 RepID=A0A6G5QEG1_9BACT|nr:hypothetical protein [Campylobacter mucosalis]QCD43886.1 hypothetical protein CMUC_0060 [Campylobacter mucosalis CCUG 21559]QKF62236.1 hypothetical protein CMCT_0059 [Campylobacter mucosalis]
MQTITLRANETLINQILAISKALAKANNQTLETIANDEAYQIVINGKLQSVSEQTLKKELHKRANEAKQGIGVITLNELKTEIEQW